MESSPSQATSATPAYGLVFLVLAVFTGLEVGASYLPEPFRLPILVVLAAVKAGLVLLFFMHLKYDRRTYAIAFVIGLVVIVPLVLAIVFAIPRIALPAGG